MKNIKTKWWIIGVVVLIVALIGWSKVLQSSDPAVVAQGGIHWHPQLEIFVKGEKIEIPQNIGLGAVHKPMHTHDDLPIIHLEFGGVVREKDLMLENFFRNWGKDMRSFGANMRMTVNGVENTEFENYMMRDGDKIELRYD
ncbi:hypothetical protein COU18_01360 [Candidatus Kaiserbacteria bacterium CG10_big_fil_rev_8_21_14_0_10_51_14]|uniref:Uncharacterized protein n=1 Tax=Candidatus Kaiserbacteria bacterium CG10_big_fil_rev_8_21_14_0_10_51_14 TaxID=1974610 RepID=A0A2H0UED2_9BACT|nr:MAG: hypothetical protein COU18_01360 [Candidatus Kaiserbacteria bacterium CG10_big_fil_rev_8_21_14_0_10_51_14]